MKKKGKKLMADRLTMDLGKGLASNKSLPGTIQKPGLPNSPIQSVSGHEGAPRHMGHGQPPKYGR